MEGLARPGLEREVRGVQQPEERQIPLMASGKPECLDHAAAVMFHLGNMLMASGEKIRVTIERDQVTGWFEIKREVIC